MTKMKSLLLASFITLVGISTSNADSSGPPEITKTNAEFVYKYLLGEIAGQRGDLSLASQLFLDLAKKTQDPRLEIGRASCRERV